MRGQVVAYWQQLQGSTCHPQGIRRHATQGHDPSIEWQERHWAGQGKGWGDFRREWIW